MAGGGTINHRRQTMILGERVRLRAIERSDLPAFVNWLNDPEVSEFLMLYSPLSNEQEERWFKDVLEQPAYNQPMAIEVRDGESWITAGNCSFHVQDWRVRSAELGIFIGEKGYWGQGYGSEVMRLLLDHGFHILNLNRIYLRVYENNHRAIRAYEKAGFVHEGRMRQAEYRNGVYEDVLLMSVLRSEWQGQGKD
jgi:RimJ/RimL family protein N-acetyltransferase